MESRAGFLKSERIGGGGAGGHVTLSGDSLFPARARSVAQATIVWPLWAVGACRRL